MTPRYRPDDPAENEADDFDEWGYPLPPAPPEEEKTGFDEWGYPE